MSEMKPFEQIPTFADADFVDAYLNYQNATYGTDVTNAKENLDKWRGNNQYNISLADDTDLARFGTGVTGRGRQVANIFTTRFGQDGDVNAGKPGWQLDGQRADVKDADLYTASNKLVAAAESGDKAGVNAALKDVAKVLNLDLTKQDQKDKFNDAVARSFDTIGFSLDERMKSGVNFGYAESDVSKYNADNKRNGGVQAKNPTYSLD